MPAAPSKLSLTRRSILAAGAALGLFAVSRGVASAMKPKNDIVRPPGSLIEESFNTACVRCESCSKACLGNVIRPARLEEGIERYYTPVMDFSIGKCERCGTCGQVCPTGAIISVSEDKMKIGTAAIDREKCIVWNGNKKCLICMEVCPADAIVTNNRGRPLVNGEKCIGCGSCQLNCPVENEKAITISNIGERRRAI
jgi:ferredoxin-type protein NapG